MNATLRTFIMSLSVGAIVVACSSSTSTSSPDASAADTSTPDASPDGPTPESSTGDANAGWKSTGQACVSGNVCCQGVNGDLVAASRCVDGVAECPSDRADYVYVPSSQCIGARDAGPG
jgi:hypothetical protein